MREIVISFDGDSNATFLDTPITQSMFPEAAKPRRASHVVPMSLPLASIFRALRAYVGDESAAASWTRTWNCEWVADLSPVGGPCLGPFKDRTRAIDAEVMWLNENFL